MRIVGPEDLLQPEARGLDAPPEESMLSRPEQEPFRPVRHVGEVPSVRRIGADVAQRAVGGDPSPHEPVAHHPEGVISHAEVVHPLGRPRQPDPLKAIRFTPVTVELSGTGRQPEMSLRVLGKGEV